MKWHLLIGLSAFLFCAGCRPAKPVLRLYCWADYIKPSLVSQFEEETGCRVAMDTFDSNAAMLAVLEQGSAPYDLVFPSDYFLSAIMTRGWLQPINHQLVPNLKHLDPGHLKMISDKTSEHSVPYMVCITGIAYRKSLFPQARPSWRMFGRTDLKGRMTLLDDARETIGAALKMLGFSLNTTNDIELAAARDAVMQWKNNSARFDNTEFRSGLATGTLALAQGYSGDLLPAVAANADIVCAVPDEGAAISYDLMVIPQGARHVELAHRFINFLHDPNIAAENMEFVMFLCPNKPAYDLLSPEVRSNAVVFPMPEILTRLEVVRDLGPDNAKYNRIWDQIKAAN